MYENARAVYEKTLREIQEAGLEKRERIITSPQGAAIRVAEADGTSPAPPGRGRHQAEPVLNFCANNYLGLSSHPRVIAAAKAAIDTYGFGLSCVRFICGTQDAHKTLEAKAAAFLGDGGRHPLLVVLRRQRRPLRDAPRRGGRDHQRRPEPRLDHRRRPPLQGRAPPLPPRRHGGARGGPRDHAGEAPPDDRHRRRLLHGRRRGAARAHLRSRRALRRAW